MNFFSYALFFCARPLLCCYFDNFYLFLRFETHIYFFRSSNITISNFAMHAFPHMTDSIFKHLIFWAFYWFLCLNERITIAVPVLR